ncbi:M48 family metallopeptidase [Alkalibacillus salilacus]|uniref:Metal-dependent hydrolase n=1 Tax=Alkalibacillus salilacus TaxID=284582 RepID=A0ABT9VIF0_9BACI|nr:SprT family zinc-dependent metalloprotease [Alkalibacillus salilacus]MDQ0160739.1 putative metal-dependent hydrolase [Alkalibacillus salilacus]
MTEQHQLEYGSHIIQYEIERKNVKHVNLNIKPNMTVVVSAHQDVPLDFIQRFVQKKASWILKHLGKFEKVQPEKKSEREYVSGESYKYLGKQYRLRVKKVQQKEDEHVKYLRGFLYLYVTDPDQYEKKEALMTEWYRKRARVIFQEALDKAYSKLEKYEVPKPTIQIRTMRARWGSCLKDSETILLNVELIKAPKHCIEYVVLHELIHFKYNDHSDQFYQMLYALMPDWEKRKVILDEEVVREL